MEKPGQTGLAKGWVIIISACIIGLSFIGASGIKAYGSLEAKKTETTSGASFIGRIEREIESDRAKLSLTLTRTASTTEQALAQLEKDRDALREAVSKAGVSDAEYSFHQVKTQQSYYSDYGDYYDAPSASGYRQNATQTVVIESKLAGVLGEFAQVAAVDLTKDDLRVTTQRIEFSYSKLDELQRELQKEAAKDAEAQAKDLLGAQLGGLRNMARPEITVRPLNANDYDYYAIDNTSLKKKVTVTVQSTYRIK